MEETKEKRSDIIHAITSPLGFFALSLLIVEGFLTIALVFSNLNPFSKFIGMIIGAFLFLIVVIGVWFLVWFKADKLTFSEDSHLKFLEMKNKWGTSEKPEKKSVVENNIPSEPVVK